MLHVERKVVAKKRERPPLTSFFFLVLKLERGPLRVPGGLGGPPGVALLVRLHRQEVTDLFFICFFSDRREREREERGGGG